MTTSTGISYSKPEAHIARRSITDRFFSPLIRVLSVILLVGLVMSNAGNAIAGDTKVHAGDEEVAAIQAAVFNYFEGINEQDRARLEGAFDTSAQLKSPDGDGAVKVEPIADAIARWLSGEAQQRTGKILKLDITENQVAQVVFDYDGIFVDFLTLLQLDGQWKIVDKVFIPQ